MKTISKLVLAGSLLFGLVCNAHAWNYQASGPWANVTYGSWTVYQNGWGSQNYQAQTLYANSASNFATAGSWSGGGVKCYAHAQGYPNLNMDQTRYWCTSNFNVSSPPNTGAICYDWTYDLWTTNHTDEIMILESLYPGAGGGWGTKIASNVSIGGHAFDVWQANPGWNVIQFVPLQLGRTSGSEDLWGCMKWCNNNGKLWNHTWAEISFGIEVTATNGWQQFTCNSFGAWWGTW